jgi:hypothetical protein
MPPTPEARLRRPNKAQAQRTATRAKSQGAPEPSLLTDADIHARIDSLGDVGAALTEADPEKLTRLYEEVG